ncbi:DUF3093 family protein [Streptomyces sp. NPDC047971]|uniref:DUF3093 family protein n=1 Tax=Streptomyces sp. NPDC047971 TaxID=3154499 RepID=UPI0033FED701
MYVEKLPKTWTVFCVAVYLAMVVRLGVDALPEDTGVWLLVSAAYLLVLVPCIAVPLSKAIYHRVRVDPGRGLLRVGRERIPLTDVDPASVHQALRLVRPRTVRSRYLTPAGTVQSPLAGLQAVDRDAPRLVGGGWAVPMGMDSVVVRTVRGERLSIATHDGAALLTALDRALSPAP